MYIKIIASGSSGNCYTISDGQTTIMLECGIKYNDILKGLNYNISEISACFISHSHKDHSLACKEIYQAGIDIYIGVETSMQIKCNNVLLTLISAGNQFTIGSLAIVPFDNHHCHTDGLECPCLGFLIYSTVTQEKLLFATDTSYIEPQFKGLNYIMVEVNYIDDMVNIDGVDEVEKRRFKSHMSLNTALEFLKNTDLSKVKQIYALHLSKDRCNRDKVLTSLRRATGKEIIIC